MSKQYRTAFIAMQSGHDFSPLLDICEELKFCTHGYETERQIEASVRLALQSFNPTTDIIVPVGNVTISCVLGAVAGENGIKFNMAIYKEKQYHVQPVWAGVKRNV